MVGVRSAARLPDGQISPRLLPIRKVHSRLRKFSAFAVGQITGTSSRVPRPYEGRIAIVTTRGPRDAMDVFAAPDERCEADGEAVWS